MLGIDYGSARIGVAIADPLGLTAQPYQLILNTPNAVRELVAIIEKETITECVIGLPKDQFGNDSKIAAEIRTFVLALETACSVKITLVDERFSSQAARRQLHSMGIKTKNQKSHIDMQAAMFILQGVLDAR